MRRCVKYQMRAQGYDISHVLICDHTPFTLRPRGFRNDEDTSFAGLPGDAVTIRVCLNIMGKSEDFPPFPIILLPIE